MMIWQELNQNFNIAEEKIFGIVKWRSENGKFVEGQVLYIKGGIT